MVISYDLESIKALFEEENPQKLAEFLDEMLLMLVCYSDTQKGILNLADHYHRLRLLRDSFQQTHILEPSLNGNSGH